MKMEVFCAKLSAPARRAMESLKLTEFEELAAFEQSSIAQLHGIGPSAMKLIEQEMASLNIRFHDGREAAPIPNPPAASVIDEYIDGFPPHIQEKLRQIRSIIREEAPDATETLSYQIPTFNLSGNLVHFAGYARHIGFYPGRNGITVFRHKLTGFKSAAGSVQFPIDQPLPTRLIRDIVRFRVQENLDKSKKKRKK